MRPGEIQQMRLGEVIKQINHKKKEIKRLKLEIQELENQLIFLSARPTISAPVVVKEVQL